MLLSIRTAVKAQSAAYQGRITDEDESIASSVGSVTRSQEEHIRTQQIPAVRHSGHKMVKNTRHIEGQ